MCTRKNLKKYDKYIQDSSNKQKKTNIQNARIFHKNL